MNISTLINSIKNKREVSLIAESAIKDKSLINNLWAFLIMEEKNSWRAAWVLDSINESSPETLKALIPKIIEFSFKLKSYSTRRHLLKIISTQNIKDNISGDFINNCFDTIINNKTPVAVRVHAMQIMANFAKNETGLANELYQVIESITSHNSPAFRARARKILKTMSRKHNNI